MERDNEDVVLLKPEWIRELSGRRGQVPAAQGDRAILKDIRTAVDLDEVVVKAVAALKNLADRGLQSAEWSEEDGLVLFRGKVYVPKDKDLRRRIVAAHHDSMIAGHPGRWRTLELISRNYWWPNMTRFVAAYVRSCDACNRTKIFPSPPAGTLMPNAIPTHRWQFATCDLIVGLPESRGFDAIMVAVDRLSKQIHVAPTTGSVNSEGVATIWRDRVWVHHRLQEGIISDRGPQFVSAFTKALHHQLGIKTLASTAYHPQTDGQTERVNQEVEQYLRLWCNERQDDWADLLSMAEFCYNNHVHASTQQTPFMLATGQNPRMGFEPRRAGKVEAANQFAQRMQAAVDEARAALQKAAEDMARFYNAHRDGKVEYDVGDKVWLDSRDITTTRPAKKLDDKWFGPYEIVTKISRNAYKLKLPKSMKIHPVFHVTRLPAFIPDPIAGRVPPPPPEPKVVNGEVRYEVESIENSRLVNGRLHYLVKWKGYTREDNSWEPESYVDGAKKAIADFYRRHPSAPRRVAAAAFATLPFQPYENLTATPRIATTWERGVPARRDAVP